MPDMSESAANPAPLVSVLMSVHNGARYLQESIESILKQSFVNFEFLIIDDGSTDASAAIVRTAALRDNRIRAFNNGSNLGLSYSLNKGLALARGVYFARQDADDISSPERFSTQLAMFEADPALVLVGSAYWVIDSNGKFLRMERHPLDDLLIRWGMLFHNAFAHSSVMFRADLIAPHSLQYDATLRFAQDYDLWSRFLDYGRVANCAAPLLCYRVHDAPQRAEMCRQQQETANRIAKKNLAGLGVALRDQDVVRLREFQMGRPFPKTNDLHCQRFLLQIMSRFVHSNADAAANLAKIRISLVLGTLTLVKNGASCLEIIKLSWGFFRLCPLSFAWASFSALYFRLCATIRNNLKSERR